MGKTNPFFALVLATLLPMTIGCAGASTKETRTQKINVAAEPPGARILVMDETGTREVGSAPLEFEQPYEVEVVDAANHHCWWWPALSAVVAGGLGGGLMIGGVSNQHCNTAQLYNEDTGQAVFDEQGNPVEYCFSHDPDFGLLISGIVLASVFGVMNIAGVITCGVSESRYPGEDVEPNQFKVIAEAPGYLSESKKMEVPGTEQHVRLVLEPGSGAVPMVATPATVEGPPAPQPTEPAVASAGPTAAPTAPPAPAGPRGFLQATAQPNAWALVVGIESYRDVSAPAGARADAQAFAELATTTLGVPKDHVILALDSRASRSDIEKHITRLRKSMGPKSRLYFFFAGHGAPDAASGTAYLLPYDGDPSMPAETAMPLSGIMESLSATGAGEVIAMVDACFSGAGGRSVLPPGARPLVRVQDPAAAGRVALFTASGGSEISGPAADGSGGLFSGVLLEAIGTARADIDGDGQISLAELHQWVAPRVTRAAKKANRDQTPRLVTGSGVDPQNVIVTHGFAQ